MKQAYEPLLHPVAIADLRPTQMTVGLREVARKRAAWRMRADRDGPDFLGRHMIPAVRGPNERLHLIDHHHLIRALHDEGVTHVLVSVVADLSWLKKPLFWAVMDKRNWLHPFDEDGRRHDLAKMPKSIAALADDPHRSLAGELRRAGGFAKADAPYAEFQWADYLRRRIPRRTVEHHFERALVAALAIAHQREARYLPGWCGPDEVD